MHRRLFLATILCTGVVRSAFGFFDHDHEDHGKREGSERARAHRDEDSRHVEEKVQYFRPEDRILLSRYYPVQTLPPGLRKKYARTGTLPPGWQKRLHPLPVAVVQRLPPLPPNCDRGYVDGYAVVYNRTTRVILDSVDLIGALTGH